MCRIRCFRFLEGIISAPNTKFFITPRCHGFKLPQTFLGENPALAADNEGGAGALRDLFNASFLEWISDATDAPFTWDPIFHEE